MSILKCLHSKIDIPSCKFSGILELLDRADEDLGLDRPELGLRDARLLLDSLENEIIINICMCVSNALPKSNRHQYVIYFIGAKMSKFDSSEASKQRMDT